MAFHSLAEVSRVFCQPLSMEELQRRFPNHVLQTPSCFVLRDCWAVRLANDSNHLLVIVVCGDAGRQLTPYEKAMVEIAREAYPVASVHWLYMTEDGGEIQFKWDSGS